MIEKAKFTYYLLGKALENKKYFRARQKANKSNRRSRKTTNYVQW